MPVRGARRHGARRRRSRAPIWVETIPFNETRDYVKKVLANAMVYSRSLDQAYVPLKTRLGTVQPRGSGIAGAASPATD